MTCCSRPGPCPWHSDDILVTTEIVEAVSRPYTPNRVDWTEVTGVLAGAVTMVVGAVLLLNGSTPVWAAVVVAVCGVAMAWTFTNPYELEDDVDTYFELDLPSFPGVIR